MFTGIIEELGEIKQINNSGQSLALTIAGNKIFDDLKIGDSVAVNGVCLTVTSLFEHSFTADVMPESVRMTTLLSLNEGHKVNLERAMLANGRFGGHIVAGHVDGIGKVKNIVRDDISVVITIETSKDILNYIIYKGSIAIDGASLTVSAVDSNSFSVSIIPHTLEETLLGTVKIGSEVNLETDITGRYIRHFISIGEEKTDSEESAITYDMLRDNGFL